MRALLDREVALLDYLKDVDVSTTAPVDTNVLQFNGTSGKWEPVTGPGGGSGETNTASNLGISGVSVYDSKVGVDIKLRSIDVGSSRLTITYNAGNGTVEIDRADIAADELTDIDTTTVAPTVGDVLTWDGSNWTPQEGGEVAQLIKEVAYDDANNYVYSGEAAPGTLTSAASTSQWSSRSPTIAWLLDQR